MSLDERTLEWLKGKSDADYPAPCVRIGKRGLFSMHYCLKACDGNRAASPEYCPLASDFRDASEFEARVAAKMASTLRPCENCPDFLQAPRCPALGLRPYYCMLRNARLAVEAEMEKEEE